MKDNKYLIPVLLIATVIVTIMGGTFAYWNWQTTNAQKTNVTFTVGSNFSCGADGGGNITSSTLAPTDCTNSTYAIKRTITTSITNNGADPVYMDLWLDIDSIGSGLTNSQNFKYALTTDSTSCTAGLVTKGTFNGKVAGDTINLLKNITSTSSTYYLYIWLDKAETNASTQNQSVSLSLGGECSNNGVSCPNQVVPMNNSTPNAPVLDDGMIPVTIANDGTVTTVATNDATWYNYQNQEWANAVLVKENGVKTRTENKTVGTVIDQSDILAYYVWIPRYKYAFSEQTKCGCLTNPSFESYPSCYELSAEDLELLLQFIIDEDGASDRAEALEWYDGDSSYYIEWYNDDNDQDLNLLLIHDNMTNNPRTIDIVFESGTPTKSTGTAIGTSYYTHPAFTFGSEELPGFWVGKFETSADTSSICYTSTSSSNCNNTNQSPRIVPNVKSLVYQTVGNQFATSLKFAGGTQSGSTVTFAGNSTYGLTASSDSHMMKNSEWGAVAYLSHSNYGINEEIRINNFYNSSGYTYKTGFGAETANASSTNTITGGIVYGSASSYPQSTTGNISGVFDMSGGANEYVMGNFNGTTNTYFSTLPASKYYDNYPSSTFTDDSSTNFTFCTLATCGGHALNETRNWYDDYAGFVSSSYPWFMRGCHHGSGSAAGVFYSGYYSGDSGHGSSWRGVLVARQN